MESQPQRRIRNRDIPRLQKVYYIMQDIVLLERKRQWEKERMNNITAHLSSTPGGGGMPKGLDESFAAIAELEERHKLLVKSYSRELKKAEETINSIANGNMRTFVTMLYLDNIPGSEVRERLNMTRRGFDTARDAVEQAECMAAVVWQDRYILEPER